MRKRGVALSLSTIVVLIVVLIVLLVVSVLFITKTQEGTTVLSSCEQQGGSCMYKECSEGFTTNLLGKCAGEDDVCCVKTGESGGLMRQLSSMAVPETGVCPPDYPTRKDDRCFK